MSVAIFCGYWGWSIFASIKARDFAEQELIKIVDSKEAVTLSEQIGSWLADRRIDELRARFNQEVYKDVFAITSVNLLRADSVGLEKLINGLAADPVWIDVIRSTDADSFRSAAERIMASDYIEGLRQRSFSQRVRKQWHGFFARELTRRYLDNYYEILNKVSAGPMGNRSDKV